MLKNLKIRKRLIAAFLIAIILSSLSGVIGTFLLTKSDSDYSEVLENYGFSQGDLGNLGRYFQASRVLNLYIITAPDQATRTNYRNELSVEDSNVDTYMLQVKARNGSALGEQMYNTLSTQMQTFRTVRDQIFDATENSYDDAANIVLYRERLADSSTAVRETLDTMIEDKSAIGMERSQELTQQMALFRTIMVVIILLAFACAIFLAYLIALGIARPLGELERSAKQMAQGDYNLTIQYQSQDEVGSLAESMRQMMDRTKAIIVDTSRGLSEIANGNFDIGPRVEYIGVFQGIETAMVKIIGDLSETMAQLKMSADQVASGSEQVSSGAQALAQGTTEQASSVEQLSAAINEVSQQLRDTASNTELASHTANLVGGTIHTSNEQMTAMMGAMSEISSSSAEISKIIKTIEDIAFQTNILALNAAVEAARAGSAGKGFAVVADEVRNLATKSSEAAKQTNALIEGSVQSVDKGVKIANETAKSLEEVVSGAEIITALILKISEASSEQSNAISQINSGVEQISSVVQTNSATSEESAAASEELNGQATLMKQMVGKFRIKPSSGNLAVQSSFTQNDSPLGYRSADRY